MIEPLASTTRAVGSPSSLVRTVWGPLGAPAGSTRITWPSERSVTRMLPAKSMAMSLRSLKSPPLAIGVSVPVARFRRTILVGPSITKISPDAIVPAGSVHVIAIGWLKVAPAIETCVCASESAT